MRPTGASGDPSAANGAPPAAFASIADRSGGPAGAVPLRGKKRPGCRRFCQQAGGFGAECDEPNPEDCNVVDVFKQTLDGTRDQVVSIRATCKLEQDCIGAIILTSFKGEFEYGRADLEIPAGQTARVKVSISKKGLEYLKKHGKDKRAFATIPLIDDTQPVSVGPVVGWITVLPPG